MAFRLSLDRLRINGEQRPLELPLQATTGDLVELRGWALQREGGRGAGSVLAKLDNRLAFPAQTQISRPDLAATVGAAGVDCGFEVTIPTNGLRPAEHRLFFVMTGTDRLEWASSVIPLRLAARPDGQPIPRQIVLAAGMKSGGRHVASVLLRYFGFENPDFGEANDGEHLLTDAFLGPALDRPFVLHYHLAGRAVNLNAISYWALQPIVTWRNLGDVVISLDDHTRTAREGVWRNTYAFLEDRESYNAMPEQRRFQYQIRNAIPWYLGFYLSWRLARVPLMMRYEWMVADERAYFRYLIERLTGEIDEARLDAIVAAGPTEASGFNVGRAGRSRNALSEESQTMLEAAIREHPSDIRELLYELPWYAEKYGAPQVVSPAPNEVYVLAEGEKRRASAHWLRTHGIDPGASAPIDARDLEDYRSGVGLY